jgi:5-formyltetrahydrofolate cyclo-ligase
MPPDAPKALLRTEILARRGEVAAIDADTFALRIAAIGAAAAAEKSARVAAAYLPIKGEASPVLLLERLAAAGVITALPVIVARNLPLVFRRWQPGDPLVAASFGLREPAATAPAVVPDLIFVPLLAFDRRGHRLGYGAGYYDRTLEFLRASQPIVTVGIAHAIQEVSEIPAEAHDQRLDCVLTDREWINCQAG